LTPAPSADEAPAWDGLKRAIMASSGFQSWCMESERTLTDQVDVNDQLVMTYLRETLETLAY
ncbi:MAG: hypothetical protein F6K09_07440, partial [Merismopedia sp. SIO2A8]|nr:hypothetical protein [Merismopedia sp. SIO2A8]